jgi:hypothetical protein
MANRVHIGELRIRVPGLTASAARMLGERIAAEMAAGLPTGQLAQPLSAINIRMPAGASEAQLPREIAQAILRSLR